MPNFSLTRLGENTTVTDQDILGEVALINVWATWCVGCKEEHQLLLSLAEEPSINLPIIGINWKDQDQLAIQWLDELGNPYQEILSEVKDIKLIASGGISTFNELPKLAEMGCEGTIIGKAIYEHKISMKQLENFILNN